MFFLVTALYVSYYHVRMTKKMKERNPLSSAAIVAANIRAESARQGLKQADLAKALGVTHGTVNMRWNDLRDWALDDLDPIAELLGIEPWELLRPVLDESGRPRGTRTPNLRIKSPLLYH